MKVLVIGGTGFIGRYLVGKLLQENMDITLLNRGKRSFDLFGGHKLTQIIADRRQDLSSLGNQSFDLVVDTCGYYPSEVESLCRSLQGKIGHYLFISSVSVYDERDIKEDRITENSSVKKASFSIEPETINKDNYGALKFQCEEVVRRYFLNRNTIVRPSYVLGPHDHTYRLAYWMETIARGGDILFPGKRSAPFQFIDVRELASLISFLGKEGKYGIFNAVGDHGSLTFFELLQECQKITASDCRFIDCSEDLIMQENLPLWSPQDEWITMRVSRGRIDSFDLFHYSYQDTLLDFYFWIKNNYEREYPYGMMSSERQQKLIQSIKLD